MIKVSGANEHQKKPRSISQVEVESHSDVQKKGTTMPAIVKERIIAAPPQRIFNALTQQEEIAHWWTEDLNAKPEVGSLAEFRFSGRTFIIQVEIAELKPERRVTWKSRQGRGFEGTTITWQITPVQHGARVVFKQDGFAQADGAYEQTGKVWEYFLASLQSYLETGKGTPGFPADFFSRTQ